MGQAELSALAALVGRAINEQTHPERVEAILERGGTITLAQDPDEGVVIVTVDDQEVARIPKATIEAVAGHVQP